jgi:hypothetical protein
MNIPNPANRRQETNERRHRACERRGQRDRRATPMGRQRHAHAPLARHPNTTHWLRRLLQKILNFGQRNRDERRHFSDRRLCDDRRFESTDTAALLTQEEIRFLMGRS